MLCPSSVVRARRSRVRASQGQGAEIFQRQVGELFQTLVETPDELLSLAWLRDVVETALGCESEFKSLVQCLAQTCVNMFLVLCSAFLPIMPRNGPGLKFLVFAMVLCICNAANITCPNCGKQAVPYPLSTDDTCGDPKYCIFCNNNQLQFKSANGTAYRIVSIDPSASTLVIRQPALANDTCISTDFRDGGLVLNDSLPFNISKRNTVMLFNCSEAILLSPLNCTSSSLCHQFVRDTKEASPCQFYLGIREGPPSFQQQ